MLIALVMLWPHSWNFRCLEERSTAVHSPSTAEGLDQRLVHGWDHKEAAAQLHILVRRCCRARCISVCFQSGAGKRWFGQPRAHHGHGLTARLGGNGQNVGEVKPVMRRHGHYASGRPAPAEECSIACSWVHRPKTYTQAGTSDAPQTCNLFWLVLDGCFPSASGKIQCLCHEPERGAPSPTNFTISCLCPYLLRLRQSRGFATILAIYWTRESTWQKSRQNALNMTSRSDCPGTLEPFSQINAAWILIDKIAWTGWRRKAAPSKLCSHDT